MRPSAASRLAHTVQMRPNLGKILHCEAQAVYFPMAAACCATAAVVAVKQFRFWSSQNKIVQCSEYQVELWNCLKFVGAVQDAEVTSSH